jgi:hypothetical protein
VNITSIKGDVVEIAPARSQAVALWLRDGFNQRFVTWHFRLASEERELIPLDFGASRNKPWLSDADSLWELIPVDQQLRYLYVFSNPENAKSYKGLSSVAAAMDRCLDRMASIGVKSLAMIHIPASENGSDPTKEENIASAAQMVNSISSWQSKNSHIELEVILVDMNDEFPLASSGSEQSAQQGAQADWP